MDYEVTLEKSLEERRILKLTLQPLVENARYHGIKNKKEQGTHMGPGIRKGGHGCAGGGG